MKNFVVFLLLTFVTTTAFTQVQRKNVNQFNAWYMYFGDHKVSNKWGIHLEAQFRRHGLISDGQQLLLRTGINHYFNDKVSATAGYGFIETYPYGEMPSRSSFPEHRIWEQMQIKSQLNKTEWISRFRLEQRFSKLPVNINNEYRPGNAVYTNRMRLLNRFSIPFKGKAIEDRSLYVSFYDEILINFGKNVGYNIFDQNRGYAAIGYKMPGVGKLEAGYMNHLIFKPNGNDVENNHTLMISLTSNIKFF